MAKRGGRRPGAGRPKGALASATIEQKGTLADLARSHTTTAINVLVAVAKSSDSDSARVSAASAILDRGYGKPAQALEHTGPDGGAIATAGDARGLALAILAILREAKVD